MSGYPPIQCVPTDTRAPAFGRREALPKESAAMPWGLRSIKTLLIGLFALSPAMAAPPENNAAGLATLQSLSVEPRQLDLHGANPLQQLLITGISATGKR